MDDMYFYHKFLCITLMLSIKQQMFTHYMQKISFCKANSSAATPEVPCILQNPKVHYHLHRCRPLLRILIKIHPVHAPTSHLLKIDLNIILPSTPVSRKWSLTLRFSQQNPVYTFQIPIRATCPAYLILPYFITQKILCERSRSLSSS